jgi:hypothetical protein
MNKPLHHLLVVSLVLAAGALAQQPPAPPAPPAPPVIPAPPVPGYPSPASADMARPTATPLPPAVTNTLSPALPDTANISITPDSSGPSGISVVTNASNKNLISINFEHAPLTEVIRAFTLISGANIVLGTNGHELVTLSMKDVEWEPALGAILDSAGKALVLKSPGIYVVANKTDTASEPVTVEVVQLKFMMASTLLPTV